MFYLSFKIQISVCRRDDNGKKMVKKLYEREDLASVMCTP